MNFKYIVLIFLFLFGRIGRAAHFDGHVCLDKRPSSFQGIQFTPTVDLGMVQLCYYYVCKIRNDVWPSEKELQRKADREKADKKYCSWSKERFVQYVQELGNSYTPGDVYTDPLFNKYELYRFIPFQEILHEHPAFEPVILDIERRFNAFGELEIAGYEQGELKAIVDYLANVARKEQEEREIRAHERRLAHEKREKENERLQQRARIEAQKKAEDEAKIKQDNYKQQTLFVMQSHASDLIEQYELYQQLEEPGFSSESSAAPYMVKRVEALRDHVHGKDVWKEEKYQVSKQGQQLLREHDITITEYQMYFGNQIQHTLHQEFVDIVHDTAHIRYKDGVVLEDVKNITTTITRFADIGQQHNHAGYVVQAFSFADFCHGLKDCAYWIIELDCDIAMAFGKGIWNGTGNFINKISDPVEALKKSARGFGNLILLLARIDQKMEEKIFELQQKNFQRRKEDELNLASGKVTKEQLRERYAAITQANLKNLVKDVKASLYTGWKQLTRDNMLYTIEKATEVGTESFLTAVTFQAVGSFIGNASTGLDEFIEAGHGASKFGDLPFNSNTMQAVISYEAITAEAVVASAQAIKAVGVVAAEVLDDASKLALGLVLLQNGSGGDGPSNPVSGTSGNISNPPIDPLQEKYTVHIEGIGGIDSNIANLCQHSKDHIMAEHHLWARLVKDPKDFDAIARIMTKVMKEGQEESYIKNIYSKVQNVKAKMRFLKIGNETVQVNFVIEDGEKMIGNAWVRS